MVLGGVAVLADLHASDLRLGRGEAETIAASLLFTGQILWLERPVFAAGRAVPVTLVMFAVRGAAGFAGGPADGRRSARVGGGFPFRGGRRA